MESRQNPAPTNICPALGAASACGVDAGETSCWWAAVPPIRAVPEDEQTGSCYCPDCLKKRIDAAKSSPAR